MIPKNGNVLDSIEVGRLPTKNYKAHIEQDKIYGYTDGIDAVKQAIYFILSTERYKYCIYDWNYGVEFNDLIGSEMGYAIAEIERRIIEALIQDDRILKVHSFVFEINKKIVTVTFKVDTIYGQLETGNEVNL